MEKATLARSINELIDRGLLTRTKVAIRPGGPGSSGGAKAAEYDLPMRQEGVPLDLAPDDARLEGAWRIRCEDLRAVVRKLTNRSTLVLIVVLAQDRGRNGGVQFEGANVVRQAKPITARNVVDAYAGTPDQMDIRKAERGLKDLEELGLVRLHVEASGRRPSSYWPSGHAADGLPWKRSR